MRAIVDKIRHEPVLATALVQTGLLLLAAFGLDLNPEQMAAVLAFTGAVLAIVARQNVKPMAAVAASENGQGEIVSGPAAVDLPDDLPVDVVPAEDMNTAYQFGGTLIPGSLVVDNDTGRDEPVVGPNFMARDARRP